MVEKLVILKPILSVFWTHKGQRARVGWRWGNWLLIRKSHLRAGWIFPYLCLREGKNTSYVTLVDFGLEDTAWKWTPLSKQHFCFKKINVFKSERWSFYTNIFACNRDHSGVDISVTAWIAPLEQIIALGQLRGEVTSGRICPFPLMWEEALITHLLRTFKFKINTSISVSQ